MSLQEKFQITTPHKPVKHGGWVDAMSTHKTGEAGYLHRNNKSVESDATIKGNFLPPGMDINNQKRVRINKMPFHMAGEGDVSGDVNAEAFDTGFTRIEMGATDDQYTGEHVDHFYGDAGGFVERNNYLDRE